MVSPCHISEMQTRRHIDYFSQVPSSMTFCHTSARALCWEARISLQAEPPGGSG